MHNIDSSTGRDAIAYIGSTPWHQLGTRATEEESRIVSAFFKAAGLDFVVERRKIAFSVGDEGAWQFTKRGQAIVRTDTGNVLGIVGPAYREIQNSDAGDVLRPLVEELGLQIVVAGALGIGETCWALVKLPTSLDITGDGDMVNGYALLRWSHDGSGAFNITATPIRVVCQNTLNLASQSDKAQIVTVRHTASAEERLKVAAKTVAKLTEALIATGETFGALARRNLSGREVIAFIESVFPQDGEKLSDTVKARRATVAQLIESGVGANLASPNGPTAWGAYNAVTEYFDHVRPAEAKSASGRERAAVSAVFGGNNDVKRFALAQARQLVAA